MRSGIKILTERCAIVERRIDSSTVAVASGYCPAVICKRNKLARYESLPSLWYSAIARAANDPMATPIGAPSGGGLNLSGAAPTRIGTRPSDVRATKNTDPIFRHLPRLFIGERIAQRIRPLKGLTLRRAGACVCGRRAQLEKRPFCPPASVEFGRRRLAARPARQQSSTAVALVGTFRRFCRDHSHASIRRNHGLIDCEVPERTSAEVRLKRSVFRKVPFGGRSIPSVLKHLIL